MSDSSAWPPIQEDPDITPDSRDPIAAIQARLRKYPHARVELGIDRVTVFPLDATGFQVTFADLDGKYLVCCDGWQEHFDSLDQALECFAMALSPEARLQVWYRGRMAYRWQFQVQREREWVAVTETGLLFFPFWRRRTTGYLQNNLRVAA